MRVLALELDRQRFVSVEAEAERLRRLLGFAELSGERRYVGTRVIGIRLGTVGRQLLTVDRGSDDGIAPMMPVVVAEGVVGRVHAVSGRSADVLVLTDLNSSNGTFLRIRGERVVPTGSFILMGQQLFRVAYG